MSLPEDGLLLKDKIPSTNMAQSPSSKRTLISSILSVNQCLDQEILVATSL